MSEYVDVVKTFVKENKWYVVAAAVAVVALLVFVG